jgi:hypothetical protein
MLALLRMRAFTSRLARFVQRDPISHRAAASLYVFGNGVPTLAVDPYGLQSIFDMVAGSPAQYTNIEGPRITDDCSHGAGYLWRIRWAANPPPLTWYIYQHIKVQRWLWDCNDVFVAQPLVEYWEEFKPGTVDRWFFRANACSKGIYEAEGWAKVLPIKLPGFVVGAAGTFPGAQPSRTTPPPGWSDVPK